MMELRVKTSRLDANNGEISGYINVTERESEVMFSKRNMKWFKEVMKKGVFHRALAKALRGTGDIPLLFDHDWSRKLASVKTGTLELMEDNIGLRFSAKIQDEEALALIKNGEINGCSFGFRSLDEEVESINSKMDKRFVNEIELVEVSVVHDPAYIGSLVEARSLEEALAEAEVVEETPTTEEEVVVEEIVEETPVATEEVATEEIVTEEVTEVVEETTETVEEVIEETPQTSSETAEVEVKDEEEVAAADKEEVVADEVETLDADELARQIKTQNAKLVLEILKKKII